LRQDIDCPSIYGDPALLYPLFYKPLEVKKKYRYGLIPHYLDFNNDWIKKFENNKDVKIINIRVNSINSFIDEISECEMILSSSLHGIIAGDSYGIPSYWMELSKNVQGNGFKFKDYFSSVGRPIEEPIRPNYSDWIKTFSDRYYKYKIDINLDLLYNACPFKKD
jgi:pyruvyltransferase